MSEFTIDPELARMLQSMAPDDEVDVLVYASEPSGGALLGFLEERKREGSLRYTVLRLAGCIVVKAPKRLVLEVAARDDVTFVAANPKSVKGN